MTCAIIIAAHNCDKYIMDCVDSVKSQLKVNERNLWRYDMRIGVDGCAKTANVLKKNNITHYCAQENVGAYVMRNSLIYLSRADMYAYFDADDVMGPDYLRESILAITSGSEIVMAAKYQCGETLQKLKQNPVVEQGGAMTFTHSLLEKLGGFQPYRCAGDTDFMHRAEMAGHNIGQISKGLYYRRRHPESLTRKGETCIGSEYRKRSWSEMCEMRNKGIIKIVPEIVRLEKWGV